MWIVSEWVVGVWLVSRGWERVLHTRRERAGTKGSDEVESERAGGGRGIDEMIVVVVLGQKSDKGDL
jgi:hypothetical protein